MVAVAIGGAAVIGGATSVISGNKAAKAQQQGAEQAAAVQRDQIEEERRQYDTTRADFAPYRQTGYGALDKLAGMYGVQQMDENGQPIAGVTSGGAGYASDGGFTASPGYQFRLSEGVKAAERSASARGLLGSGGTMKAIQRYGEGLASSEYDTYANRLAALAGVGQSATNSTAAAGQAAVAGIGAANNGIANSAIAAGNARASSYANTGSAINGTINNLGSLYLNRGSLGGGGFGGTAPTWSY